MGTQVIYSSSQEELAEKGASLLFSGMERLLGRKQHVVLGLPGGRSVAGIYRKFRDSDFASWDRIHIFMVDERMVGIDDEQSNFRLIRESFAGKLIDEGKMPAENLHPFILQPESTDRGIGSYNEEFRKYGNAFDAVLLGVGEDGHVGALYPGHHSIRNDTDIYFSMDDSPKPPASRMTASRSMIENAEVGIAVFLGEAKREAFEKFMETGIDVVDCPAKLVNCIRKGYALTNIEAKKNNQKI
jgi:6-phosphogluconolactonase